MITWIVIAIVAIAFVVLVYARYKISKQHDILTYDVPGPTNPYARLGDALMKMNGHRSMAEWERYCQASLQASRRRRGL